MELSLPDIRADFLQRVEKLLPPLLAMQRSSWEQGSAAQALLECYQYDSSAVPHALAYIYGLVHDAIVRQGPDGRLAVLLNGDGSSDAGAIDPACIGECFYHLMAIRRNLPAALPRPEFIRLSNSVERMLDYLLDPNGCPRLLVCMDEETAGEVILSHRTDAMQIWSDSVYMLPPFLASAAVYYMNHPSPKYSAPHLLRMALQQIVLSAHYLQWHTGEWSHIYDLDNEAFKRKAFWGVGNGWACCGIVRVFRTLARAIDDAEPGELSHSRILSGLGGILQQCYTILITTIDGCLRHIRDDGLFHDVLDDPTTFVETNLAQQLAYTLERLLDLHTQSSLAVQAHLPLPSLDQACMRKWEDTAADLRTAAKRKTDEWGLVRDVCGSPRFDSPGTAAEGQAWGILMEVAHAEYYAHVLTAR